MTDKMWEEIHARSRKECGTHEFDKVTDSGQRQDFETGSVRDSRTGKGRYDLVTPIALRRLARHYENGAVKYKDRNWEKGQPLMRYYDSAMRHMQDWIEDILLGRKHKEDHLAAVAWNIFAIIHTEYMIKAGHLPKELDDRPFPESKEAKRGHALKENAEQDIPIEAYEDDPECQGIPWPPTPRPEIYGPIDPPPRNTVVCSLWADPEESEE